MSPGSINLTDDAFASQRMTALSTITSNRGTHALQSERGGIETNSQLVGKQEAMQKRASGKHGTPFPRDDRKLTRSAESGDWDRIAFA